MDTVATHLGELVTGAADDGAALERTQLYRSAADPARSHPGINLLPNSVIMAGVTGGLSPSGDLNPGNLSIDGQRESSNGFLVDGIDVQEHMNGGTSIVANLDSIDEFRVLTNNFDPEYGNYNGGMVTVITKSGSDSFHGNAFEFLRNTALDARGYFDPSRPVFRQNQFGGTLGGPVKHQKVYFFGDYQGTRTNEGVETGEISVPSLAGSCGQSVGSSPTIRCTGTGIRPDGERYIWPSLLSQKLGYAVYRGRALLHNGCTTSSCVFPNAVIPKSAWSAPALGLLQYIPSPNLGTDQFSTSAYPQTVRDDKASGRIDANGGRWGQLSAYYFFDDYRLDNPYPGQQGGASIPGFDALTFGRAQLVSLGDTKVFGTGTVNEFHMGYLRNANVIGQPQGGLGVSLAAQGFVTNGVPGFTVQAPQFEGVENIVFPSFVMGVPITNETQINNTLYLSDTVSKVIGTHTLKIGGQFHCGPGERASQRDVQRNLQHRWNRNRLRLCRLPDRCAEQFHAILRPAFLPAKSICGTLCARQLAGANRSDHQLRTALGLHHAVLGEVQPDCRPSSRAGSRSSIRARRKGWWFPAIRESRVRFRRRRQITSPRESGLPTRPRFDDGILKTIFGDSGKSSIRASYGIFYTAFPGLSTGVMYAVPPFGLHLPHSRAATLCDALRQRR